MKETVKEGRLYALFGKALLLSAAAFVMLWIDPLIAHAEAKLPLGSEDDGYYIDADGNMTVYSQEGLENWAYDIQGGPGAYKELVRTLTVNEGVTMIEIQDIYQYGISSDEAFEGCRNLTSVSLPASLTEIGRRAFFSCRSLTSVTFAGPSNLETIGEDAFLDAKSLTTINIPDGVTSIGDSAFELTGLTSVTIPASVESIGSLAFRFCTNLHLVTMLGETPPTLGDGVFESTGVTAAYVDTKDKQIYVPKSSIQTYKESWTQWTNHINDGGSAEDPDPPKPEDPDGPDTPGNKGGGSAMDLDPTRKEDIPAVGNEGDENYKPAKPAYADTTIDVQAHTVSSVVYSVDVEWGAMTFRYENSIWDATAHQTLTGAGWKVYDSVNDEVVDATEDAINRIQVTNHSNAEVKAALAYAGRTGYEDTTGSFAKAADDTDTSYDGTALTLASADNNAGEAEGQGKATVGCVYFMPSGIKEDYKTAGITKWTQLGTITVGVETADQAESTD